MTSTRKLWSLLLIGAAAAAVLWQVLRTPPAPAQPAAPATTAAKAPAASPAPDPVVATPAPQSAAPPPPPTPPLPVRSSVTPGMIIQTSEPAAIAARMQPPPRGPEQPPDAARDEADSIALNLRQYGGRYGGNPSGTNAEIIKALNGGNPQGVRFLPQELLRLNAEGELLDRWDTPYFFHQMSASHMEVRSAGPDKVLWTSDDIVVQ